MKESSVDFIERCWLCTIAQNNVRMLERMDDINTVGDMYFRGHSAIQFFRHWLELLKEYESISMSNAWLETFKHSGEQTIPPMKVSDWLQRAGMDPNTLPEAFYMRSLVYKMFDLVRRYARLVAGWSRLVTLHILFYRRQAMAPLKLLRTLYSLHLVFKSAARKTYHCLLEPILDSALFGVLNKVKSGPKRAQPKPPSWIWKHDPEKYAYENYDKMAETIKQGILFDQTDTAPPNYPRGYRFQAWSIDDIIDDLRNGNLVNLGKGEWD
ncbi:hypothetical protein RRF57_003280 [Xylaria bambusicola]|uniref:Uncharacterized protein n=1 Tax=Xylaria bambusicola TaxID=326684 RepID=A0AAN7U8K1_9PEZI